MGKSFTYKIADDGGTKKVFFLNSSKKEITKHFIRKNEAGKEYFDIINPYINYEILETVTESDMDMSVDNIGDCIQSVIDGYGDKMFVNTAPTSFTANVVKYLDEDLGKKEREELLEEYKKIVWKYSIKFAPRHMNNNFYSYVIQKDGLNYITNLIDDSDKAITFNTFEDANAFLKELSEAIEYHVGNRLASYKKSRRPDIISDSDPNDILKVALRYSDMTGRELDKKYELKVIQILV